MGINRKAVTFPSLIFGVLFLLISLAGLFQIHIIRKNADDLLRNEGDILVRNISKEIHLSLEYLTLVEKSGPLLTPSFLNIMAYDEAVTEYVYATALKASPSDLDELPFSRVVYVDRQGKVLSRKGEAFAFAPHLPRLVSGEKSLFLKLPGADDRSLVMGIRSGEHFVFVKLVTGELEELRKRFVIRDILESEEKRLNVVGIRLLDKKGTEYLSVSEERREGMVMVLKKSLDTRFMPGFTIEILLSRKGVQEVIQRTSISFVAILLFLAVAGGFSVYAIFLLHRRYEKRMQILEKEMELKERLVSLGRLASGMAHEIKNPLNAIGLSVQRLKREFSPEPERKGDYDLFVDVIRSELGRVDRIVEEFLLSARSHAPFLPENLVVLVDEVMLLLRERSESQEISLVSHLHGEIVIECQRERLKQVFYNILLNAIEAIGRKGTINIRSKMEGKMVRITVSDSGPGIGQDVLHLIFDYHYTTKDKGMGLGLPISYMIAKDHGGDIRVVTEEGKGASFAITLACRHPAEERGDGKAGT